MKTAVGVFEGRQKNAVFRASFICCSVNVVPAAPLRPFYPLSSLFKSTASRSPLFPLRPLLAGLLAMRLRQMGADGTAERRRFVWLCLNGSDDDVKKLLVRLVTVSVCSRYLDEGSWTWRCTSSVTTASLEMRCCTFNSLNFEFLASTPPAGFLTFSKPLVAPSCAEWLIAALRVSTLLSEAVCGLSAWPSANGPLACSMPVSWHLLRYNDFLFLSDLPGFMGRRVSCQRPQGASSSPPTILLQVKASLHLATLYFPSRKMLRRVSATESMRPWTG